MNLGERLQQIQAELLALRDSQDHTVIKVERRVGMEYGNWHGRSGWSPDGGRTIYEMDALDDALPPNMPPIRQ